MPTSIPGSSFLNGNAAGPRVDTLGYGKAALTGSRWRAPAVFAMQ
jgi:hypothetical protein